MTKKLVYRSCGALQVLYPLYPLFSKLKESVFEFLFKAKNNGYNGYNTCNAPQDLLTKYKRLKIVKKAEKQRKQELEKARVR